METKQTEDVTGSILRWLTVFCGTILQHFRMIQILSRECIENLRLSLRNTCHIVLFTNLSMLIPSFYLIMFCFEDDVFGAYMWKYVTVFCLKRKCCIVFLVPNVQTNLHRVWLKIYDLSTKVSCRWTHEVLNSFLHESLLSLMFH